MLQNKEEDEVMVEDVKDDMDEDEDEDSYDEEDEEDGDQGGSFSLLHYIFCVK